MSRAWTIAYVQTCASIEALFTAVARAARAELEGKIYGQVPGSLRHVLYRECVAVRFSGPRPRDDLARPGVVVYPQKHGLYSLWVTRLICGPFDSGMDPVSRASLADGFVLPYKSVAVWLPRFFACLSRVLPAQIALVLFETNARLDATLIQFYQGGEMVGDYYHLLLEGRRDTLCMPVDPGAVEDLFDGRFAFVLRPYRLYDPARPDGPARFFSPEEFGCQRVHEPATAPYNPEVSRLFIPFQEEGFQPFGAIFLEPGSWPSPRGARESRQGAMR